MVWCYLVSGWDLEWVTTPYYYNYVLANLVKEKYFCTVGSF